MALSDFIKSLTKSSLLAHLKNVDQKTMKWRKDLLDAVVTKDELKDWFAAGGTSHTHNFLQLTDTPNDYTGDGGKVVSVNVGEDALEFIAAPVVITDHGSLSGLEDDDHTQYLLADGTRSLNHNASLKGLDSSSSPLDLISATATGPVDRVQVGDTSVVLNLVGTEIDTSYKIVSGLAIGTAPFQPTSTTLCTNLNADLLDGEHASAFADATHNHVEADITDLDHNDTDAIHDNVAAEISALTEKTSPAGPDVILIEDSEDSYAKKYISLSSLPFGTTTGSGVTTDIYFEDPPYTSGDDLTTEGEWTNLAPYSYYWTSSLQTPPSEGAQGCALKNATTSSGARARYDTTQWTSGIVDCYFRVHANVNQICSVWLGDATIATNGIHFGIVTTSGGATAGFVYASYGTPETYSTTFGSVNNTTAYWIRAYIDMDNGLGKMKGWAGNVGDEPAPWGVERTFTGAIPNPLYMALHASTTSNAASFAKIWEIHVYNNYVSGGTLGDIDHGILDGLADDDHPQYLPVNGSRALTANWDAGGYEIRSLTFESDVATGTAPFTIASTTVSTNLNADLVDGFHGTALSQVNVQSSVAAGAGTWTKPTTYTPTFVKVVAYGGGGGGGGGSCGTTTSTRQGGCGGGGGARIEKLFLASQLAATESFSVGAAGSAGAGGTTDAGADGEDGGDGGSTTFSSGVKLVTAFGGGGGSRGYNAGTASSGGSGAGSGAAGAVGFTTAATGGGPGAPANPSGGCGANAKINNNAPECAEYGGGAGGGNAAASTSAPGGGSIFGGSGGGHGGGVSGAGALVTAKDGGGHVIAGGGGGAAGTNGASPTAGTAGATGTVSYGGFGGGGGGGTVTANTNGAVGGAGGACGGGGGGGGVGGVTGNGGNGGLGGVGGIYIITW